MKKSNLASIRFSVAMLSLFVLVSSFQNCSQVIFQQTSLLKSSDSGVPYGGMQKQDYYRFVPDFSCQDTVTSSVVAPVASLHFDDNGVILTENKNLRCSAVRQNLDLKLIDRSVFQNEVVGYLEGIFEGLESTPTSIPANLVEVWCRDREDQQGIETITHFDRVNNQAVNRIYFASAKGQTQEIADFPVARVVGANTITVKDGKGFELIVHRDQPALQAGLFKGSLEAVIDGQKVTKETSCRLGGSVDPQVWPNQQIVDLNVIDFKISPNQKYFSYITDSGASLYTSKIDGSQQLKVNSSRNYTDSFNFTSDSKSLLFTADNFINGANNLMIVNVDGTAKATVNPPLEMSETSVAKDYKVTVDGLSLVYRAGFNSSSRTGSWDPIAKWLYVAPLAGGSPVILNPPFVNTLVGVSSFEVSSKKVAFLCCDEWTTVHPLGQPDLYSVNLDGTGLLKITPPMPAGADKPFEIGQALKFSSDGSSIYIGEYVVAADGTGSTRIPSGWATSLFSPSGEFALLLSKNSSPIQSQVVSLKTGKAFAMPSLKLRWPIYTYLSDSKENLAIDSIFFTQDSKSLIGRKILSDGELQAVSTSTLNGDSKDLCPGVTSSEMLIQEVEVGVFLVLTYDQSTRIFNIYKSNANSSCVKVNSVAVSNPNVNVLRNFVLSPDKQKIIAKLAVLHVVNTGGIFDGFPSQDTSSQLFYVPLNGKPALLINSPVTEAASVSQAIFLSDSATVVFVGNQIRTGETGVFRWSAP